MAFQQAIPDIMRVLMSGRKGDRIAQIRTIKITISIDAPSGVGICSVRSRLKNSENLYRKMTAGKLEITIKINELPQAQADENGWQQFEVDCDGCVVTVALKPKIWKKLVDAQANYQQWVASITGKMGDAMEQEFVLFEPNVQTFEKKPKPVEAQ